LHTRGLNTEWKVVGREQDSGETERERDRERERQRETDRQKDGVLLQMNDGIGNKIVC